RPSPASHFSTLSLHDALPISIGGLIGIGLSVALGSVHVRLPILIGGVLFIALALALALVMPETGFKPAPRTERASLRSMGSTFRDRKSTRLNSSHVKISYAVF